MIGEPRTASRSVPDVFGHPRGLFVLFLTEMWERFSYYGMRALLILYLVDRFGLADSKAYAIYGSYTALVYLTPMIGGIVADRQLGFRKAIQFGAALITLGHALLAWEGLSEKGGTALPIFYAALACIVVGTGFLKANVTAMVGILYGKEDSRRDAGFTIYYIGINVGAALGAIVSGWLGETYGWGYGFGSAGIGMLLGLVTFVFGTPAFAGRGEPPNLSPLHRRSLGLTRESLIYAGAFAGIGLIWLLVRNDTLTGYLLAAGGAAIVVRILWLCVKELDGRERAGTFASLLLILLSVLFWALYEQAGSSLNLFTERRIDRHVFGVEIPASVFQALNSVYIIILAPGFAAAWTWLARRDREPSIWTKFGLAMIQLGAGFLVLVIGAGFAGHDLVPVVYLFLLYLLHTTGELCLAPVGLSAVTRLSVPRLAGFMMGAWVFAAATGNMLASLIATATGNDTADPGRVLAIYQLIGWVGIGCGVAIIVGGRLSRRWKIDPS